MKLNTASSAISFAKKLEDDAIKLYEDCIRLYPEREEIFLSFIRENEKNKTSIDRAYYGVISDALEGCFSFEGIDTEDFVVETDPSSLSSNADVVNRIVALEETIARFYSVAGDVSRALMADIPRLFHRIAMKRQERIVKIRSLQAVD